MNSSSTAAKNSGGFLVLVICLVAVLGILFHKSFDPNQALFANDAPVGITGSQPFKMPKAFFPVWNDYSWIGMYNGHYQLTFSGIFHWFAEVIDDGRARVSFYPPVAHFILGMCAWLFFRRIGCNARASVLAGLAAALNMNFMSNAAWGLPSRGLALAATFLALAAIETGIVVQPILTSILAGFAIGMAIIEGGDNGAIFSLFIGFYALWRTWIAIPSHGKAAAWAFGKVFLMVVFAAVMASQSLGIYTRLAAKGTGATQDLKPEEQWTFATQWSLPKAETLRVIIPGLFGYRLKAMTPDVKTSYWGRVGEHPSAPHVSRSSGAGEYAGVLVVLIGIWAIVQSFRSKGPFSETERRLIKFWGAAGIVAMFLGWGRHTPVYEHTIYMLPFFKTMRNPMKFFHALHLCLMVLFAYGLIGIGRRYLDVPAKANSLFGQLKAWWAKAPSHEKLWTWGCIAAIGLSALGWFGYMGSRSSLVKHLSETGFSMEEAAAVASFSIREVLVFVLILAVCVAVLTSIISGAFSGARAKWATVILGAILVLDLARADKPWIFYSNWKQAYATNPVFDVLRDKPFEHRVAIPNLRILVQLPDVRQYFMQQQQVFQVFSQMYQIYQADWLQHQFPYLGIQSLDMPQEPRPPPDKQAYLNALGLNWARLWELTNTRYILGEASTFAEMLNQKFDPAKRRFGVHTKFGLVQAGEGIGAETNGVGPLALIEFTGTLPRAKLYNNWEVVTNETAALARLADANWDPAQSVVLSEDAPKPTAPNSPPGKAEIVANPSPRRMEVQTTSDAPAMLLLNDKLDPEWRAYIDGQPAPLLHANYLMRGVHVPAGTHKVVFQYEMKPFWFRIVLACDIVGLILVGIVVWSFRRQRRETAAAA
jgi:hypothetical protein